MRSHLPCPKPGRTSAAAASVALAMSSPADARSSGQLMFVRTRGCVSMTRKYLVSADRKRGTQAPMQQAPNLAALSAATSQVSGQRAHARERGERAGSVKVTCPTRAAGLGPRGTQRLRPRRPPTLQIPCGCPAATALAQGARRRFCLFAATPPRPQTPRPASATCPLSPSRCPAPAPRAHTACAVHGRMNAYADMLEMMPKDRTHIHVFACEHAGGDGKGPVPVAVHSRIQQESTSCASRTSLLPRRGAPGSPEPLCCRACGRRRTRTFRHP